MTAQRPPSLPTILASLPLLACLACGEREAGASAAGAAASGAPAAAASSAPAKVAPFVYPAPVSGHFAEVNTGEFDLVDGLAYSASAGGGTVVYVTSKAIASPVLTASPAPMTEARAIALLRDAAYLEVTLDAAGKSSYFASGTQLGGRSRAEDSDGRYWQIDAKQPASGRTAAKVVHKDHGEFEFDLPIAKPAVVEVSEGDRVKGRRVPENAATPDDSAVLDLYRALQKAARAKDLAAFLAAQGFPEKTIAAVRGLPEIDADFAVLCDRFLDPGEPGEATVYAGSGGVRAKGVNSKGEKFSNYYEFVPCDKRLLFIGISEDKL